MSASLWNGSLTPSPAASTLEYYQMLTIPPGARSIRIYEMNISTSYISARNALRRYYLNGHWAVDWPGRYKFSGTTFDYRRSYKEPESLTSAGPTNETLIVEVDASLLVPGLGFGGLGAGKECSWLGTVLEGRRVEKALTARRESAWMALQCSQLSRTRPCPTAPAPPRPLSMLSGRGIWCQEVREGQVPLSAGASHEGPGMASRLRDEISINRLNSLLTQISRPDPFMKEKVTAPSEPG